MPQEPAIVEAHTVEGLASTVHRTPAEEKWIAIRAGMVTVGFVSAVAILVLGTRDRSVGFNGTLGRFTFKMYLSQAINKAA